MGYAQCADNAAQRGGQPALQPPGHRAVLREFGIVPGGQAAEKSGRGGEGILRTYIAMDLEATGMQPERDEVIEIGAVKFRDGQVIGRWGSFVRPSQAVPYKVTQLTG